MYDITMPCLPAHDCAHAALISVVKDSSLTYLICCPTLLDLKKVSALFFGIWSLELR